MILERLELCVKKSVCVENEEVKELVQHFKGLPPLQMRTSQQERRGVPELHKEWLNMVWKQYSPQAHKGVAVMCVADERFRVYYDKIMIGCAAYLQQAVAYLAEKI